METISETVVPLGSLALIFAVITVIVFTRKIVKARKLNLTMKTKMESKRKKNIETLDDQKKRLESLLKR